MAFLFYVEPIDARHIARWIQAGTATLWRSLNLSDPGRQWVTNGEKPHWAAGNPERITNLAQIGVRQYQEVKRFHVAVRRGAQGLSWKLKDGSQRRLGKALDAAGEGASYRFDYETQEAVILSPVSTQPLDEWLESNPLTV